MHPLLVLYRLQSRAVFRRLVGNLRSVKGVFLALFGVAVIGLWLAPSLWQAMRSPRTDPRVVQDAVPILLLATCLLQAFTSGGDRAIAFTPAEVDFLFPGPFTRRQLLAYKVAKTIAGMLFSATILSIVLLQHAAHWSQAWVGLFLAMFFLQLVGMCVTLVGQSVGERAYTRWRKVALAIVIVGIAVAVLPSMTTQGARPGFFEVARTFRASRVGSIALAPLEVFGRLFTAETWWPTGLMYTGLALAIDAVLLAVVFYLDADYLEAAATRSAVVYDRLRRIRQGGVMAAAAGRGGKARGAIPTLPFAAGAGPIAWRQATSALRSGRGMLMMLLLLAVAAGPAIWAARASESNVSVTAVGAMAWITIIVGAWLRFDFRGDLDQLDYLKSLPIAPWAVAAGQLVTPTLLMTACHLAIVAGVSAAAGRADRVLLFAAAVCLPFNAMLFAIENLIFLLFPTRAAANPADFQGYGRQILLLFAKAILTLLAVGVAGAVAMIVHVLTQSWAATAATAGLTLTAIAVALLPAVGWAYRRFDVAGDVPPP
jgi:hypothetical protein